MVSACRLYWLPLLGLVGCLGGSTSGGRIRACGSGSSSGSFGPGPGPGPNGPWGGGGRGGAFQPPPAPASPAGYALQRWRRHAQAGGARGVAVRPLAATTMAAAPSSTATSTQRGSEPPLGPQQQQQQQQQQQMQQMQQPQQPPRRGRRWREGEGEEGGNGGPRRWHPVGGDLADVTLLRSVESSIRESRGELNATACRGALQACSRLHQPDKAVWVIEEMRRRGPSPDAECYALAIDTVARKGHWSVNHIQLLRVLLLYVAPHTLLRVLRHMLLVSMYAYTHKPNPTQPTHHPVHTPTHTHKQTNKQKQNRSAADGLLQSMRAAGLTPGPGGYGVVMAACHRAGQGERVLALLEVCVRVVASTVR
jgi:hypothetical protein